MSAAYESYRQSKIESGLLYQDFIADLLLQTLGLPVVQYSSRVYQLHVGESRQGIEIKHDEKYATTGNLWIEVAEKARPRAGDYVPSGIFRGDNSWLYVIGDYNTVFGFPKNLLQGLSRHERFQTRENKTLTSRGFLLPNSEARKYAAFVLAPQCAQRIVKAIQDLAALGRELHRAALANPAQRSFFDAPEGYS